MFYYERLWGVISWITFTKPLFVINCSKDSKIVVEYLIDYFIIRFATKKCYTSKERSETHIPLGEYTFYAHMSVLFVTTVILQRFDWLTSNFEQTNYIFFYHRLSSKMGHIGPTLSDTTTKSENFQKYTIWPKKK